MIIGIAWKNAPWDDDRFAIIRKFQGAGFVWADTEDTDPFGDRKTHHVGDDMLIVDVEEKEMWSGDWGTYVDLEVSLNYARFMQKRYED